jgi:NDP-sugar pyrophosphorylase family protein
VSLPVAILAGGMAKRLRPVSEGIPKILLDVAGRPFAEHQIALLQRHGISTIVFCVGFLGERVQEALGDGSQWGMTFRYVFDGPRLLGTGGAVRRALPLLGPDWFVMYGDSYLDCDFAAIEARFRASGRAALMTVYRNEGRWDRSNVLVEDGRIVRHDKAAPDPAMRHIDYGLGILSARAFAPWQADEGAFDLVDVYQRLIAKDDLAAYEVEARFYEIGSPEGLAETRALFEARRKAVS